MVGEDAVATVKTGDTDDKKRKMHCLKSSQ